MEKLKKNLRHVLAGLAGAWIIYSLFETLQSLLRNIVMGEVANPFLHDPYMSHQNMLVSEVTGNVILVVLVGGTFFYVLWKEFQKTRTFALVATTSALVLLGLAGYMTLPSP